MQLNNIGDDGNVHDEIQTTRDIKVIEEDLSHAPQDGNMKRSFPFTEDFGTFYVQILSKGDAIPRQTKIKFNLCLILCIVLQGVMYLTINGYVGISLIGTINRNEATASKDLAPKCFKDYVNDWKQCIGSKQVLHGEDDYHQTDEYKKFIQTDEGRKKCESPDKSRHNELCLFEINESYGGMVGVLRIALIICGCFIALKDVDAMSQSVFMYKHLDESLQVGFVDRIQFTLYCIIRVFFIYWGLLMIMELTTNALYFQAPMDLCMNFAALAFLLDIDDIICSSNYFVILKTKHQLFQEEEYDLAEIESMDSITRLILPKSSQDQCKFCNCCSLSIILIVLVLLVTIMKGPLNIIFSSNDFHEHGGPYWLEKFGGWYDEDWFRTAMKDSEYKGWIKCSQEMGLSPWECMKTQTNMNKKN